jgi:hypothetical protein
MEVADVLSARAVEVSFASALSVVTSATSTHDGSVGNSSSSHAGGGSNGQHTRPQSTPPNELSHMLKSQLLDYAPASMGIEERAASGIGAQLLQHSHTINVSSLATGARDGGALDAVAEQVLQEMRADSQTLRRFSSTSAASRGELHTGSLRLFG